MKKIIITTATGLFFLVNAGAALAAVDYIPPFDGQHQSLTNGIDYYSGGVGITERDQMENMTKGCNLKLVFDNKSGDFLAGVAVTIRDAKGHVAINAVSQGPWFSAKLPAGTYQVTTLFDHHKRVQNVTVTQKPQSLILSWNV